VLDEVRALARWTSYKKAYADICLRADLFAVDAMDGDEAVDQFDKEAMYGDLLSQDREVVDLLEQREEGALEWAWFGEVESAGGIQVDMKKAEKVEREVQQMRKREQEREKSGRKLFRTSSRVTETKVAEEKVVAKEGTKVPAPRVRETKVLLEEYVRLMSASLEAAREAGLK
jgi:hypothetical protein